MSATITIVPMEATGNRFAVVDGFRGPAPRDPVAFARRIAERADLEIDGLLLVLPVAGEADAEMVLYNRDGSRAETCGNGLRCVARLLVERAHVRGDAARVVTEAGTCAVEVQREGGAIVAARVELGVPVVEDLAAEVELDDRTLEVARIDMGNPHCVLFVDDVDEVELEELGPALEHHPDFPSRTNVEFVAGDRDGLELRVWERGVGETESCGSGAAAAAVAALLTDRTAAPARVGTAGGTVLVDWDGEGVLEIEGAVAELGPELPFEDDTEEGPWRSASSTS